MLQVLTEDVARVDRSLFHTPQAFVFLYEQRALLTFSGGHADTWSFGGERDTLSRYGTPCCGGERDTLLRYGVVQSQVLFSDLSAVCGRDTLSRYGTSLFCCDTGLGCTITSGSASVSVRFWDTFVLLRCGAGLYSHKWVHFCYCVILMLRACHQRKPFPIFRRCAGGTPCRGTGRDTVVLL